MKLKLLLASAVLAASSGLVFAAGYTGPGSEPASASAPGPVTTVAEAMKAADDTPVVLTGYITQRLRKEHYKFKEDGIGYTIEVEIDDDEWPAQAVSEATHVRLYGEVEHKKRGKREIDVDRVEIIVQ